MGRFHPLQPAIPPGSAGDRPDRHYHHRLLQGPGRGDPGADRRGAEGRSMLSALRTLEHIQHPVGGTSSLGYVLKHQASENAAWILYVLAGAPGQIL